MQTLNHPCEGKDCRECTTCKFDEPIPDSKPSGKTSNGFIDLIGNCNYCGYLIKSCKGHGSTNFFNACCSKFIVESENTSRPRIISFDVKEGDYIIKPTWCPKGKGSECQNSSSVSSTTPPSNACYDSYTEKRNKMKKIKRHLEWDDVKEGCLYVVPTIMKAKGKIVRALNRSEYTIRCVIINEKGEDTSYYHNIYKEDLDAVFLVEYHKF